MAMSPYRANTTSVDQFGAVLGNELEHTRNIPTQKNIFAEIRKDIATLLGGHIHFSGASPNITDKATSKART